MKEKLALLMPLLLLLIVSCKEKKDDFDVKKVETIELKIDSIPKKVKEITATEDILNKLNSAQTEVVALLKESKSQNQNKLYESYRTKREELIAELNNVEVNLLDKYVNFYNEKLEKIVLPDSLKNKEIIFKKASIEFWEIGEGYTELRNEPYYYSTLFKNKLTPDYQDFIEIEAKENTVLYSADAGLSISFKDVSERVLNWEKFLIKYPKSKLFDVAKENYTNYAMNYLFGLDNTPTIEISDNTIYPENRTEFERFVKENPNSTVTPLVRYLLETINKINTNDDLRKVLNDKLSENFIK